MQFDRKVNPPAGLELEKSYVTEPPIVNFAGPPTLVASMPNYDSHPPVSSLVGVATREN